ncbi:MAG: hypothetical protein KatS3mg060_1383 [Dehalococcoidia bacterium]|nr:MAG: hypothetical protein KatS3mg060_1383 [Dehalococcoidia bacterium]
MVDRLLRWRLIGERRPADILALDVDPAMTAAAETAFASRRKELAQRGVTVRFACQSLADAAKTEAGQFDLVLAHHVLDLLDLNEAVPMLRALAAPGAVFWLTLTFDGQTRWLPPLDRRLDTLIETAYHVTMDGRDGSRHSLAGRRLPALIRAAGGLVAVAGGSNWRVTPVAGRYRNGERVVLQAMLNFHRTALAGEVPSELLDRWLAEREAQLGEGRLGLVVHHRDVAGWFDPSSTVVQPTSVPSATPNDR